MPNGDRPASTRSRKTQAWDAKQKRDKAATEPPAPPPAADAAPPPAKAKAPGKAKAPAKRPPRAKAAPVSKTWRAVERALTAGSDTADRAVFRAFASASPEDLRRAAQGMCGLELVVQQREAADEEQEIDHRRRRGAVELVTLLRQLAADAPKSVDSLPRRIEVRFTSELTEDERSRSNLPPEE